MNLVTEEGNQTTMLYAGPLPASEVVLPAGEFELFAEVYDEANAYGIYEVRPLLLLSPNMNDFHYHLD